MFTTVERLKGVLLFTLEVWGVRYFQKQSRQMFDLEKLIPNFWTQARPPVRCDSLKSCESQQWRLSV